MHLRSRFPAWLLLGLAVLAAGLLIAGYGVAVGVGVAAGILLGLVVVAGFLAMNGRSRSSVGVRTWGEGGARIEPAMAMLEQHGRDSIGVGGVDAGSLQRVIPLGESVEAFGARVELVVLEIREDGGIATLVVHTRPPVGSVGHFVDVAVADDAGTAYVAAGQGSGGSGPGASRHEIRFAPAPPAGARSLTVRIEAFVDPFPGPSVSVNGPWEFRIAL